MTTIQITPNRPNFKSFLALIACISWLSGVQAQDDRAADAFAVQRVFAEALDSMRGVDLLRELTQDIGARPAGSAAYDQAADWGARQLNKLGLRTSRQAVRVRPWTRGRPAQATVFAPDGKRRALRVATLGNSPATPERGIRAALVEVRSLEEVDSLGEQLRGKVVFYNRPFDPTRINTFEGYGGAVDQRVYGPARAAKYGAVAALVRSMTPARDAIPHTGTTVYPDDAPQIPGIAVSTLDADRLHSMLRDAGDQAVQVFLQSGGKQEAPTTDDNVIADWRGSTQPDQLILIGAHLDSWDLGEGAHDDGAGVAHVIEAIDLLKRTGYSPRHTIRVVLFANEENGLDGGRAYWAMTDSLSLKHVAALESDSGGFVPRAFSVGAPEGQDARVAPLTAAWSELFEPYGITFVKGGGGADISGLRERGAVLFGLRTDGQRYFDLHHTELDTFSQVHPRELQLGAAAVASLVQLIDQQISLHGH